MNLILPYITIWYHISTILIVMPLPCICNHFIANSKMHNSRMLLYIFISCRPNELYQWKRANIWMYHLIISNHLMSKKQFLCPKLLHYMKSNTYSDVSKNTFFSIYFLLPFQSFVTPGGGGGSIQILTAPLGIPFQLPSFDKGI